MKINALYPAAGCTSMASKETTASSTCSGSYYELHCHADRSPENGPENEPPEISHPMVETPPSEDFITVASSRGRKTEYRVHSSKNSIKIMSSSRISSTGGLSAHHGQGGVLYNAYTG
ncbi:unnamed protein product, partial [Amoebophrya sp. A25]|eukprot:GSA25T00003464001.1